MRSHLTGIVLLLLPMIASCTVLKEKDPSIALQEIESSYSKPSFQRITEADVPKQLKQAVERAERLPGIADMVNPDYQFELDGDTYFLWISEESGAIQNTLDTHIVYTLQPEDAIEVHRLMAARD
ncbi:hypothetical protein [Sporosarcina cyprini]|uniref:hypothetical protein n=1 Tax=Sporosarcina cyprini TaxID=2910523 RepID=UPI001EDF2E34|nr:hypothetical protein [Sporosarcina cyprini]MCG3089717.1 hypothetical protein [Sporosarcina cyprini]